MRKETQNTESKDDKALHIDGGVMNSEDSITAVYGKENICLGGDYDSVMFYGSRVPENEIKPLKQPIVRRGFFGAKYLYLDDDTRVRYGFTLAHLGITYTLQRKGTSWKEVAWTYPSAHVGEKIDSIIEFLKWHEEYKKQPKRKCLF